MTVEHRASAAPDPIGLALVDDDGNTHLEVTKNGKSENLAPDNNLDDVVLEAIAPGPISRSALRSALHVHNERLGAVLTRLAAEGHVVREGDLWARVPVPPLA